LRIAQPDSVDREQRTEPKYGSSSRRRQKLAGVQADVRIVVICTVFALKTDQWIPE
jgi:hypothetical protein